MGGVERIERPGPAGKLLTPYEPNPATATEPQVFVLPWNRPVDRLKAPEVEPADGFPRPIPIAEVMGTG